MKAVAATVVAVVLVVSGVAIAALTGSRGGHSAMATQQRGAAAPGSRGDLAAAAAYLGISHSELRGELRSGKTLAQVAAATSGRSPADLAQALVSADAARLSRAVAAGQAAPATQAARLARIRKRVANEVNHVSAASGSLGVGGYIPPTARYLGISAAQLLDDLHSGRTLAQVAGSVGGKSVNGLIEALVSDRKGKLEAAAASGRLSRTKEAALLATLKQRITAAVNRVAIAGPNSAAGPSESSAQAFGEREAEPGKG
jgi:hypothetical protein